MEGPVIIETLVAVGVGFVWAGGIYADVLGLFGTKNGEFSIQLFQLESGDFFVEDFGEDVNAGGVFAFVLPEFDLGDHLIGEA